MKTLKLVFLAAALAVSLAPAEAWNGRGHMIVAATAWTHLTPQAQARATALLKLNPFYATWVEGVAADEQDQLAFVIAATWPDAIKKWTTPCPKDAPPNSGPLSGYSYCNDGEKPTHSGADANTGYSDKLEHKYWHYVDMPFSPDHTKLVQPEPPNAETEIDTFRKTLSASDASDDVKSFDLVWLEHLVGDVHQPLHATSRFTKASPQGDQGGNLVCTGTALATKKDATGKETQLCKSELHAYWDGLLGNQKPKVADAVNARAAIAAAKTLDAADATSLTDTDVSHWVADSFAIAKSTAYRKPVGNALGPYNIAHSATYTKAALAAARTQA
ncbi:MAG: S1/P1 nuclease, partial [Rhizomicrobium sp.]|nr:S1/P1 nuclease [Rhizomicrobium sp.]